jgi:hypothetical protein
MIAGTANRGTNTRKPGIRAPRRRMIACIFVQFLVFTPAAAQSDAGIFRMPERFAGQLALQQMLEYGGFERAEILIRKRLAGNPASAELHVLLAAALAGQGRTESALSSLERAAELGLPEHSRDRLRALFSDFDGEKPFMAAFERLESAARPAAAKGGIAPAPAVGGTALVSASNTIWDPGEGVLRTYFVLDGQSRAEPIVQAIDDRPARELNRLFAAGRAAGNIGDLYDNRDNGHSSPDRRAMPQLTFTDYGENARAAGIGVGVNPGLLFNAVTIGNSSMAVTGGPYWRSQPRLALTHPGGAERLFREYAANHLYVFPEHRDYDSGHGDVMPANTPYYLISEGSSGSDQPLLRAVASVLAAFRPEVKAFLKDNNLVMPTVQMIFRRGQNAVSSDGAYLSGAAHPAVFNGNNINLLRMIARANALERSDVPPMVRLSVIEETASSPLTDLFTPQPERLFDTPGAIARVIRSTRFEHRMTVSAAGTVDPNGRALTFHWVVLSGDARRIRITPKNGRADTVELSVPWHERKPVPGRTDLFSNRVDIGVFAHNGVHYSAPAFISFTYPANQWREYGAEGRIRFVDYHASRYADRYADPALFPVRDWSDRYEYDGKGNLIGWTRLRTGGESRYSRQGGRVLETDQQGRPIHAVAVRYRLKSGMGGIHHVVEQPTGKIFTYVYSGNDDNLGKLAEPD